MSNKHGHRGEREVSRKTIARGMPGRSGVTVVTTLVCLFFTHEAAGASCARHSLRPLISQGRELQANLARKPRRDREAVSVHGGLFENVKPCGRWPGRAKIVAVIARSASDEAIHSFFARRTVYAAEPVMGRRHRARVRATGWRRPPLGSQ